MTDTKKIAQGATSKAKIKAKKEKERKIRKKCKKNGIRLIRIFEEDQIAFCMTCKCNREMKDPHEVLHRNSTKIILGNCDECGAELMKKRRN